MKNEKAVTPNSKEKKSIPAIKPTGNIAKKNKTGVAVNDIITSAVQKTKPRSGGGLANEGTVVSYNEER